LGPPCSFFQRVFQPGIAVKESLHGKILEDAYWGDMKK